MKKWHNQRIFKFLFQFFRHASGYVHHNDNAIALNTILNTVPIEVVGDKSVHSTKHRKDLASQCFIFRTNHFVCCCVPVLRQRRSHQFGKSTPSHFVHGILGILYNFLTIHGLCIFLVVLFHLQAEK